MKCTHPEVVQWSAPPPQRVGSSDFAQDRDPWHKGLTHEPIITNGRKMDDPFQLRSTLKQCINPSLEDPTTRGCNSVVGNWECDKNLGNLKLSSTTLATWQPQDWRADWGSGRYIHKDQTGSNICNYEPMSHIMHHRLWCMIDIQNIITSSYYVINTVKSFTSCGPGKTPRRAERYYNGAFTTTSK